MSLYERVTCMEEAFDRARAALAAGNTELPEFAILAEYMDGGKWLADYEADEAGLLPAGMKRGVLSQDGLYNLITDWEDEKRKRRAKPVIHLFGASGSGTTTLGRTLSEKLGVMHMDTDDYFWLPTDPQFTAKRPVPERLALMQADIDAAEGAVLSGSLTGWGDALIPRFTLAVRVVTDTAVRIHRLREREYACFGERIREGGDMHEQHEAFIAWAARYDTGDATMRSKLCHDAWQQTLKCPLIIVDGTEAPEENAARVIDALDRIHA